MILLKIGMNILLLYNSFEGAYSSMVSFQQELMHAIKKSDCLLVSRSALETIELCHKYTVDFSLGIGSFNQYIDEIAVYEITRVHHFQWIIDNPLKIGMDSSSAFITYILINRNFKYNIIKCTNEPLYLPIGYAEKENTGYLNPKKKGIIFSGQIKDINSNEIAILRDPMGKEIRRFIDEYETKLDESFEKIFWQYFGQLSCFDQKRIFRMTNSFFRARKRKIVIESITDYPVYIIGEVQDNDIIQQRNIHILDKMSYEKTYIEISKYMFSLNVSPNFHDAIHDRVVRSIAYGTLPITSDSEWCRDVYENSIEYYKFQDLNIDSIVANFDHQEYSERISNARLMSFQLSWENSFQKIKERCKNNEI